MSEWIKQGAWRDKRRARRIAKMLKAPGDCKVWKVRIKREVDWRVEYIPMWMKPSPAPQDGREAKE